MSTNRELLESLVCEILERHLAPMELEDGDEASVSLEDGCVVAYSYHASAETLGNMDGRVVHAKIRLVSYKV